MQAFQHFDTDRSGYITPDEVAEALKSLGGASSADIAEMIRQYDSNNDGQIDYNEFVAMMKFSDDRKVSSLQQASSFLKGELRKVPEAMAQ